MKLNVQMMNRKYLKYQFKNRNNMSNSNNINNDKIHKIVK